MEIFTKLQNWHFFTSESTDLANIDNEVSVALTYLDELDKLKDKPKDREFLNVFMNLFNVTFQEEECEFLISELLGTDKYKTGKMKTFLSFEDEFYGVWGFYRISVAFIDGINIDLEKRYSLDEIKGMQRERKIVYLEKLDWYDTECDYQYFKENKEQKNKDLSGQLYGSYITDEMLELYPWLVNYVLAGIDVCCLEDALRDNIINKLNNIKNHCTKEKNRASEELELYNKSFDKCNQKIKLLQKDN